MDEKPVTVALGTIVGSDGWIVTKASELRGKIVCKLREKGQHVAKIIGVSDDYDLAMLKIDADDLPTATWDTAIARDRLAAPPTSSRDSASSTPIRIWGFPGKGTTRPVIGSTGEMSSDRNFQPRTTISATRELLPRPHSPGSAKYGGRCSRLDWRERSRRFRRAMVQRLAGLGLLSESELRRLRSLKDPDGIQRFLDDIPYHLADTAWSPRVVLRERTAHCLEGAIFAAAALRTNGFSPLILDLEAERDTDHVIAVYQVNGHWGAVAKSNFAGCRYREPVYRSLRELAMSYFNLYCNLRGERTLRTFSRPVNLARFDRQNWMATEKPIWFIVEYLFEIYHYKLLSPQILENVHRVDDRLFAAECLGKAYKTEQKPKAKS